MRNLARESLRTVHAVPMTAFDRSGKLTLEPMRVLIERLRDAGIRVYLPCAGSAEFHSLLAGEIVASVAMTREVAGADAIVIAPVGFQVGYAVEVGMRAAEAGADAILVMPPSAPYLSDVGLRAYYRTLLDEVPLPMLIYRKGEFPSDALLLELAGDPGVAGVKYAHNDIDAFRRVVQADGGRSEWICGSAERFAPFFAPAGGRGFTSGACNVCPRLTLAFDAAIRREETAEVLRLLDLIRPIEDYRARAGSSYNVSFLKYALSLTGLDFGDPRPPQRVLTAEERREIADIVAPILAAEEALARRTA